LHGNPSIGDLMCGSGASRMPPQSVDTSR